MFYVYLVQTDGTERRVWMSSSEDEARKWASASAVPLGARLEIRPRPSEYLDGVFQDRVNRILNDIYRALPDSLELRAGSGRTQVPLDRRAMVRSKKILFIRIIRNACGGSLLESKNALETWLAEKGEGEVL